MRIEILFENDHFIAVDKPSGWLSVPSRMGEDDKRPCLGILLQDQIKLRIFPIHRLDLEVSGLVLFAKNAKAHRAANAWFENKQVTKTYEAWTAGEVANLPASFVWEGKMVRGKKRSFIAPHGKDSKTIAEAIENRSWQGQKLVEWILNPETGRSHQLRLDLSRHGFPIAGDKLYGSNLDFCGGQAIALRSIKLNFKNCPPHKDFGLPEYLAIEGLDQYVVRYESFA